MNAFLLYLLLLKATMTSFSGLTSLPIIHNDLVLQHHVITDRQLNTAVAAGRISPGPNGLYIVSIGYMVGGIPGAVAGYFAMVTPAFLILGFLYLLRAATKHPAMEGVVRAVTLSAAGLTLSTSVSLAQDALRGWLTVGIALASFVILVRFKVDVFWLMLGAAAIGLAAALLRI